MPTLPEIQVGEPIRHKALAVFPLFSPSDGDVEYLLSDEAIAAGDLHVEEISEGGSVPNLLVTNQGGSRVLFLEGEELRGAKQNRVLNTSVLIAAHSTTKIPVSCVEQGQLAISLQAIRRGRISFIVQAQGPAQAVGIRVPENRPRALIRPDSRLARGQPADDQSGFTLRHGGHVRHV